MFNKIIDKNIEQHWGSGQLPGGLMPLLNDLNKSINEYEHQIQALEKKLKEREAEISELSSKLFLETTDLKNTHSELSRIFNLVNEGFFTKDIRTNEYLHMSVGCVKIYGYSSAEFFDNPDLWYEVIHPQDKVLVEEEAGLLSSGIQTITTYRIVRKDGFIRWIEVKAIPIIENEILVRVDGVVNDVTARKTDEQAIKDNEEKYRSFFESSMDGILMSMPDGTILAANPAACEIFGAAATKLCGRKRSELVELISPVSREVEETSRTEDFRGIMNFRRLDGTIFPGEITSSLFKDHNGDPRSLMIIRDITEMKRAAAALLMNEQQLDLIYNNVRDSIFMFGVEESGRFKFLSVNNTFLKTTGLTKDKVVGRYLDEMVSQLRLIKYEAQYKKALLEKATVSWEDVSTFGNGEITGLVNITPVLDDHGNCIRLIGSVHDITERKKSEKQLLNSERRYRTLFEQNLAGVYQTTPEGIIITCNHAFAKMLGYTSPAELLQTNAVNLYFSAEERDALVTSLRCERKLYNYEATLKRRDGSFLHILENSSIFIDPNSGIEMCHGIILDITERKKAHELLQKSEERYRQIVETAQEGITLVDVDYNISFVNKKMCELMEYTSEEIIGQHVTLFLEPEKFDLATKPMERQNAGISDNFDIPLITKTGRQIWANISASPILDVDGNYAGSLGMVTDITKRKLYEELIIQSESDLDRKNKELERKNTELEQFAYVASHDLQEPLRTTASFVKMLKKQYHGKLDDKADQYLNFIIDSSERMKILINDLLDYSRIGVKDNLEPIDCTQVINDVIADLETAITDSGSTITFNNLPVIKGYPTEIKQLFQNLTINAIKFKKERVPPVMNISASIVGDYWQFAFADNGIGISEEHYNRIFIIFQRLHTRTEYKGSGIGLSHCKKIVELHHGKIWVVSKPGEGSTFYFTIPV